MNKGLVLKAPKDKLTDWTNGISQKNNNGQVISEIGVKVKDGEAEYLYMGMGVDVSVSPNFKIDKESAYVNGKKIITEDSRVNNNIKEVGCANLLSSFINDKIKSTVKIGSCSTTSDDKFDFQGQGFFWENKDSDKTVEVVHIPISSLEKGEKYTLSYFIKLDLCKKFKTVFCYTEGYKEKEIILSSDNNFIESEYAYKKFTFEIPREEYIKNPCIKFIHEGAIIESIGSVCILNLQLEKGEIASSFKLSDYDILSIANKEEGKNKENLLTREEADKIYLNKEDLPSNADIVHTKDMEDYVKKEELENNYLKKEDVNVSKEDGGVALNLEDYLKKNEADNIYVKKEDLSDNKLELNTDKFVTKIGDNTIDGNLKATTLKAETLVLQGKETNGGGECTAFYDKGNESINFDEKVKQIKLGDKTVWTSDNFNPSTMKGEIKITDSSGEYSEPTTDGKACSIKATESIATNGTLFSKDVQINGGDLEFINSVNSKVNFKKDSKDKGVGLFNTVKNLGIKDYNKDISVLDYNKDNNMLSIKGGYPITTKEFALQVQDNDVMGTIELNKKDLNTIVKTGLYNIIDCINSPEDLPNGEFAYMFVIRYNDKFVKQIAYSFYYGTRWERHMVEDNSSHKGTWKKWTRTNGSDEFGDLEETISVWGANERYIQLPNNYLLFTTWLSINPNSINEYPFPPCYNCEFSEIVSFNVGDVCPNRNQFSSAYPVKVTNCSKEGVTVFNSDPNQSAFCTLWVLGKQ